MPTTFQLAEGAKGLVPDSGRPVGEEDYLTREHKDRNELIRLGKKPVLKRNFGFMSILGFSCTILITWEGSLISFETVLTNGGPVGLVYGFIFVWIGATALYTSLSELSSMAPTAGGQYHWVSMLAPASSRKFISYLTGCFTVIGWQGILASVFYVTATLIQGLVILCRPQYTPQPWHTVLLFWATVLWSVSINSVISWLLPKFEGLILVLHILGFFAILVPLVFLGPSQSPSWVFTTSINGGHWPTTGLSFMIGLLGCAWNFVGADGAVHMSEEIRGASLVVPRSILISIFINGALGLGIIIAMLFCIHDLDAAANTPTDYVFMEIFLQATGSVSGSALMIAIIVIMQMCANVGQLASCSRILWSFARDRGVPGWQIVSRVDPRTSIPVMSILTTAVITCLLSLIIFGSSTAFNNLVSIGVIGLYASYLTAASLLLYRRCTGGIRHSQSSESVVVNTSGAQMVWGPWHIPGIWGILINAYACCYMIIIMFFVLWPPELPVTPDNMNYCVLVVGAVVVFCVAWYYAWAKGDYKGPIVEVTSHIEN